MKIHTKKIALEKRIHQYTVSLKVSVCITTYLCKIIPTSLIALVFGLRFHFKTLKLGIWLFLLCEWGGGVIGIILYSNTKIIY